MVAGRRPTQTSSSSPTTSVPSSIDSTIGPSTPSRRTAAAWTPACTSMPSAAKAAHTSSPANGSSRASSRGPPSTTITSSHPSRLKHCAISAPIAPPPSTSSRRGSSLADVTSRLSHGVDVCEPGNRRDQRSGARRDDHRLRCLERVRRAVAGGDLHHPLAVQAALAPVERDVLVVEPLLLTIVGPVVRHVVALRERGGGIDLARDRLGGTGHPAGRGEHVTRADQRLRRDAAPVRALPADELLLDEGRCQPSFRAPAGGDLSRLAHRRSRSRRRSACLP